MYRSKTQSKNRTYDNSKDSLISEYFADYKSEQGELHVKPAIVHNQSDFVKKPPQVIINLNSLKKRLPNDYKENITPNVLLALNQISNRKKEAIEKRVPNAWHSLFFEFTGVRESKIYQGFEEGKMVYFCYHFQKPNPCVADFGTVT